MNNQELGKYQLNFHQTFAPEMEAVSRIMNLANSDAEFLTKEEISVLTAIPTGKSSGKVEPHIYYAAAMGVITFEKVSGKYKCELTPLGKVVILEDSYIVENITKLILHAFLVDKHAPTSLWSFLFNEFIPKILSTFNNQLLQKSVERRFNANVNLTPFRTCYSSDLAFGELGFLSINDKEYVVNPHRVTKEYVYLYGYVLLTKWEEILEKRSEITYEEITDTLFFGKQFLWGNRALQDALDLMQDEGLIKVNAQLTPITIIKNQNASFCLNKLYSLLI